MLEQFEEMSHFEDLRRLQPLACILDAHQSDGFLPISITLHRSAHFITSCIKLQMWTFDLGASDRSRSACSIAIGSSCLSVDFIG